MTDQFPPDTQVQELAKVPSSKSSSSGGSLNLKEAFEKDPQIVELRRHLLPWPIVSQYSFELKLEIAKCLDPLKTRYNDWRLVASELKFESSFIEKIKNHYSPTQTLLENCTNTSTKEFLAVLTDPKIQRKDVIFAMLQCARPFGLRERSPTQESTGSCCSSPYSPWETHGNNPPFPDVLRKLSEVAIGPQPSEQDAEDKTHVDFHSNESEEFWKRITPVGLARKKKWKEFLQAIKNSDFSDELKIGLDRFLCIVLKIKLDYAKAKEQDVHLDYFLHLVAWFGPFRKEGCLTKMYQLMKGSVSQSPEGTKQSWFAGHMSMEESELALRDKKPGCFLIRFSESKADEGFFVLAVKTHSGVETFQIEGDPSNCSHLKLGDQTYNDLLELVEDLRNNMRLEHCHLLLTNPCPNLCLNVIFKGYTKSTGVIPSHRGRGRGRGRARNTPQS